MNYLSLQVMTWSTVSTAVSTAVWLAMVGDATTLAGAEDARRVAAQAKPQEERSLRPVVFHPAMQARDARAPVTQAPLSPRARPQS